MHSYIDVSQLGLPPSNGILHSVEITARRRRLQAARDAGSGKYAGYGSRPPRPSPVSTAPPPRFGLRLHLLIAVGHASELMLKPRDYRRDISALRLY